MPKVARIFPTRTNYTPDDDLAFFGSPGLFPPEVDEAMVSCVFTWDKPRAEALADEWSRVCKTTLGGPAYDDPGEELTPGLFLRKGMVLTSRGCCHGCKFCFVPRREGSIRELPIVEGNRLLDSNILACSDDHVKAVFTMLKRQKGKVGLHGGFDTRLIKPWHIDLLADMRSKVERLYIAFDSDTPANRDRLVEAIKMIRDDAGLSLAQLRCFVLMGYGNDAPELADSRCEWVLSAGAVPFASYYRSPEDISGKKPRAWQTIASKWAWLPGIFGRLKREGKSDMIKTLNNRGK